MPEIISLVSPRTPHLTTSSMRPPSLISDGLAGSFFCPIKSEAYARKAFGVSSGPILNEADWMRCQKVRKRGVGDSYQLEWEVIDGSSL